MALGRVHDTPALGIMNPQHQNNRHESQNQVDCSMRANFVC
jgi:hypothetical protein